MAPRAPNGSVRDRVARRLELFRLWEKRGVPPEYVGRLPKSLRKVAQWSDADLGVYPILSPNDFSTRHSGWGELVREIQRCLAGLSSRATYTQQKKVGAAASSRRGDRRVVEGQLADAISRWHTAREELLRERDRANSAEARCARMSLQCQDKDALIAELRRKLSAFESVRAIR